jgi:RNA polymerase sporulation-specific sigma factor
MFLHHVMNVLNNIEKTVIIYRYYREKTQTQVAQLLKTTQTQISRIEKKALLKMRNCSQ